MKHWTRTTTFNHADKMLEFKDKGFIVDEIEAKDYSDPRFQEIKKAFERGDISDEVLSSMLDKFR